MAILQSTVFLIILFVSGSQQLNCEKTGPAKCEFSDNSGEINFSALGKTNGDFRFSTTPDSYVDFWYYSFNPGVPVDKEIQYTGNYYEDLAMTQSDSPVDSSYIYEFYPLGLQSSERFEYNNDNKNLTVHYEAEGDDGKLRTTTILLNCKLTVTGHEFIFISETEEGNTINYNFELAGPCLCLDVCNDEGIIPGQSLPPEVELPATIMSSCTKTSAGKCDLDDNSGTINLSSLKDSSFVGCIDPSNSYYGACDTNCIPENVGSYMCSYFQDYFLYQPVTPFEYNDNSDLAILKYTISEDFWYQSPPIPYEDIGVQQSEEFVYDEQYGLALNYTSKDSERTSLIYLVCDANRNDHEFKYLPQVRKDEYVFQFIGPCSCPDGCTDNGINDVNECDTNNGDCGENTDCVNTIGSYQCVCKPGFVQDGDICTVDLPEQSPICYPSISPYSSTDSSCICDMVDGSGSINLSSLSNPSEIGPRWTDDKDDFNYFYNPCNAFTSNQTFFEDLAVLQQNKYSIYYEYDLGVQSYSVFTNNSQGQIQLHYHSADAVRQTTVRLVCDETASNHTFTFDGEPLQTQYEFTLMGPCACPGRCDENGLTDSSNGNGATKLTFGVSTFLVTVILVLNMLFINQ